MSMLSLTVREWEKEGEASRQSWWQKLNSKRKTKHTTLDVPNGLIWLQHRVEKVEESDKGKTVLET